MSAPEPEIIWHADPWAAAAARHGDWMAYVFLDGEPGPSECSWEAMPIGAEHPERRGTAATLDAAKADAATALREAAGDSQADAERRARLDWMGD